MLTINGNLSGNDQITVDLSRVSRDRNERLAGKILVTAIGLAHNHTMKRTTVNAKGLTGIQVNLGDGADNLAIIRPTKAWDPGLREIVTGGRGTKVLIIPAGPRL